jgi:hypothetical protein
MNIIALSNLFAGFLAGLIPPKLQKEGQKTGNGGQKMDEGRQNLKREEKRRKKVGK